MRNKVKSAERRTESREHSSFFSKSVGGKKLKVGIMFGGSSSEKEVALEGGRNVFNKIDKDKYDVSAIFVDSKHRFWNIPETLIVQNTTADLERLCPRQAKKIAYEDLKYQIDFAFVIGHGKYMEDGCLQGLLELQNIPYNGSGILGSALGMDKYISRRIWQSAEIDVPRTVTVKEEEWHGCHSRADSTQMENRHRESRKILDSRIRGNDKNNSQNDGRKKIIEKIKAEIGFPSVVKPSREGCSTSIHKVESESDLDKAIQDAIKWDGLVLVEEFLEGTEITISVLGNDKPEALPITETPKRIGKDYLSLEDKFLPGGAEMITPARLPEDIYKKAQETAIKACQTLGIIGYPRVDMFVVNDTSTYEVKEVRHFVSGSGQRIVVLEVNTLPGITPSTMVFHQAAEVDLSPSQFIDKIIALGLEAHRGKKGSL